MLLLLPKVILHQRERERTIMAEASHNKRRKRAKTEEEVVAGDDFEVETIVESSSAEVETISEVDEAIETLPPNDLPPKQPYVASSIDR